MTQFVLPKKDNPLPTLELTKKAIACHEVGEWGSMTKLAETYNVSRKTAYHYLHKGQEILEQAFEPPEISPEKIYAELKVDRSHLERSIISLYTETPNAYRRIVNQIEIIFGIHISFGLIHQVITQASQKAREFNKSVSLGGIHHVALDEMFYHQTPILGGVDLESGYIFALEHAEGRTGDDWVKLLERLKTEQFLDPDGVIKDAGSGLRDGVSRAFPNAQQRDDIFHAVQKMYDLQGKLEKKALAALSSEWELELALKTQAKEKKRKKNTRSLAQRLRQCRKQAVKLVDLHDRFEVLCREARDWMEFINLSACKLRSGAECAAGLKSVATCMKALGDERINKVAKYLYGRAEGLSLWVDELRVDLELLSEDLANDGYAETPKPQLFERIKGIFLKPPDVLSIDEGILLACSFLRTYENLNKCRYSWEKTPLTKQLIGIYGLLKKRWPNRADELIKRVSIVLEHSYRASSLVENLNGRLRPYVETHRCVRQSFLDLFMAHRNLKHPGCGKVREASPYEKLTGECADDWLEKIGYPPSR